MKKGELDMKLNRYKACQRSCNGQLQWAVAVPRVIARELLHLLELRILDQKRTSKQSDMVWDLSQCMFNRQSSVWMSIDSSWLNGTFENHFAYDDVR